MFPVRAEKGRVYNKIEWTTESEDPLETRTKSFVLERNGDRLAACHRGIRGRRPLELLFVDRRTQVDDRLHVCFLSDDGRCLPSVSG